MFPKDYVVTVEDCYAPARPRPGMAIGHAQVQNIGGAAAPPAPPPETPLVGING